MQSLKLDVHPPLFFLALHEWLRVFGTSERAVRTLSGLFYVLSGLAIYGVGRELYGTRAALLCATIYLTSPLAILSARFARMYALLSLLSILSTWLFLQFSVKPRESRSWLALYVFVNILGTFTHVAFFFVLFGQIVFQFLFYRHTRIKRFVTAVTLSIIPYMVLWAPVLFRQIAKSEEGLAWLKRPGLQKVAEVVLLYGGTLWLLIPFFVFVWWRSRSKSSSFPTRSFRTFPLWLLAITTLTPLIISQAKPIFNSRFAIIGLHFFALSVAAIVGGRANYFFPVALIILTTIGLIVAYPVSSVCDNRAIANYLSQTASDGDAVIFTSLTRLPVDYYLEQEANSKNLFETSFPAEIDKHPGYEGRIADPGRQAALEVEARALVDKVSNASPNPTRRIFLFHGLHPEIDSIIETPLGERYELLSGLGMRCEVSPYFREVSVYR
jgi:mannosyltransferase